jgi:hypothetical protein
MAREFRIDHDKISDPQTITQVNVEEFKKQDLDIHRHEVERLEDDHGKKQRVFRVKNTKYFGPWSHRG